jgi:hypothetical protein
MLGPEWYSFDRGNGADVQDPGFSTGSKIRQCDESDEDGSGRRCGHLAKRGKTQCVYHLGEHEQPKTPPLHNPLS